jgi:hypothetical protein
MINEQVTPEQLRTDARWYREILPPHRDWGVVGLEITRRDARAADALEAQADALEARASDRRRTAEQAIDDHLLLADLGTLTGTFGGDAYRAVDALLAHAQDIVIYCHHCGWEERHGTSGPWTPTHTGPLDGDQVVYDDD